MLCVLFLVGLCICVEQKHNNVYYILIFNIIFGAKQNMRATPIFFAFFLLFTLASLAVPIPLFPGSAITALIQTPISAISNYLTYIAAVANGLIYGIVVWVVFFFVDKKIEKSLSITSKKLTN